MKRSFLSPRSGFTLIELLMVIVIIGILAGILIPTISGVINSTKRGALKLEVDELARAVERYRDKFGDYPPDGSDWEVFQRHLRRAFPQILASEIALLDPTVGITLPNAHVQNNTGSACVRNSMDTRLTVSGYTTADLRVMDSAEALVFFLGGFSSDPKRPFTGRGGPFSLNPSGMLQYNTTRENPFYEFKTDRLTLAVPNSATLPVYSNDEELFFGGTSVPAGAVNGNDLLPVYLSDYTDREASSPYVYFDSRTYVAAKSAGPYWNFYQRQPVADTYDPAATYQFGAVYPVLSDLPNSSGKGLPGIPFATTNLFVAFQYVEPTKFQILGPGLDGLYGGRLVADASSATDLQATLVKFPSGSNLASNVEDFKVLPTSSVNANELPNGLTRRMADNVGNFSAQTFEAGNK